MATEDLIKSNKNELNCVDTQASVRSSQVVKMKVVDQVDTIEGVEDQSRTEEKFSESDYILDLITSLNKQGKELMNTQSDVQTLLNESDELLTEYKLSVKVMKDKLVDRIMKLKVPKA